MKVVLGSAAAAVLPAVSLAVPSVIMIPMAPSPVMPQIVTVWLVIPAPLTTTVPLAVPVLFRVI